MKKIVLWCLSLFFLIFAVYGFSGSFLSGLLFLIPTILCNPLFHDLMKKSGKRLKGWISVLAVIVAFFAGCIAFPTAGQSDNAAANLSDTTETTAEVRLPEPTPEPAPTPTPSPTPTLTPPPTPEPIPDLAASSVRVDPADIAVYSGEAYIEINDNKPYFSDDELTETSFEFYSELDELGRCGVVYACIGKDLMPTEERGEIGQVRPSGWHTVRYNDLIEGNYLYNRCHLIAFQLSGENANDRNLITGTRYLNVQGMEPFENRVADYVNRTGNHVLYRVTPIFEGEDLVARGVLMEAKSVEDEGQGVEFNVYCYNVQPGVIIDYADGSSRAEPTPTPEPTPKPTPDPTPEPEPTPTPEPAPTLTAEPGMERGPEITPEPAREPSSSSSAYAVNSKNGKIHKNGACPATGDGKNAMKAPVYFDTYEEAEAYSIRIAPGLDKRKCGNCWK